jgi:hypothetical protein
MTTLPTSKSERKHRSSRHDPHSFESVADIMRRLRWQSEALMTPTFDRPLSHKIDFFLVVEQDLEEAEYDCA